MIARVIAWLRDFRIRHHHARAHQHGTATLAAQIDRDWRAAGRHMQAMHAAQAKRDALLAKQPRPRGVPVPDEVDWTLQTR